jgi:hypothetical protein
MIQNLVLCFTGVINVVKTGTLDMGEIQYRIRFVTYEDSIFACITSLYWCLE